MRKGKSDLRPIPGLDQHGQRTLSLALFHGAEIVDETRGCALESLPAMGAAGKRKCVVSPQRTIESLVFHGMIKRNSSTSSWTPTKRANEALQGPAPTFPDGPPPGVPLP